MSLLAICSERRSRRCSTRSSPARSDWSLLLAQIYLIYGFFCLYLLMQMVLRLALIDILLALAPVAMGLWTLPHSSGWSRHWLRLFMTTVFQQAVQLIALALGIGFLSELALIGPFEPARDLIWKLLMSVAFIYLATRVPSMLGNASPFDSWLQTLYFGFSLPRTMARSISSLRLGRGRRGGRRGRAFGDYEPCCEFHFRRRRRNPLRS